MKLTKGKISKLYSKKKQSLKRKVNKKRGSSRNKTFRKKRNIHLARKSLKRFHYKKQRGGVKDGEEEGMPKVDEASNSVTENLNQPTSETLDQSNIETASTPVDLSATSMEAENVISYCLSAFLTASKVHFTGLIFCALVFSAATIKNKKTIPFFIINFLLNQLPTSLILKFQILLHHLYYLMHCWWHALDAASCQIHFYYHYRYQRYDA